VQNPRWARRVMTSIPGSTSNASPRSSPDSRVQREATWSSRGRGLPSIPRELLPSHSRRSERMAT
jgi:hypothetical protein